MRKPCENIRWDLHERHLQSVFAMHFLQDRFCDVTLACKDGQKIRAHRTILCACSGYFDAVLTGDTSGKDTLVIMKDCDYQDMKLIIQFMYYGEINVDEMRLRSLLRTADGLQINGLSEAFHNFNAQYRDNLVVQRVQRSKSALSHRSRTYRADTANASPIITPVEDCAAYPFVDTEELGYKMDIKEPDWSDNEDENDCVRVYLVSEDEEYDFNLDKKEIINANEPGSTQPKSFLPFRDIIMKRSNRNTNESATAIASTNHIMDPLDCRMELDEGGDFNGRYLIPMDDKLQNNERVDPFEVGAITKKLELKNILSRSINRTKQPTAEKFSKIQSKPSLNPSAKQLTKSIRRHSSTGTSKMDLLNRLHGYLQRSFDGRIKEIIIDDLQNYSVENGKGTCQVKCPVCDKLIKIHYGKYHGEGGYNSHWILSHVTSHLSRHQI